MKAILRRWPASHDVRARIAAAAIAFTFGAAAPWAHAATCSVSTPGVAFGSYDVFAAGAVNSNGTITVTCSIQSGVDTGNTPVPYTLTLSTGSSNSFVQRQMQGGGDTLGYNLYTSNTYGQVWGDGTGSTSVVTGSVSVNPGHPSASANHTVYGRIPALQDAAVAPNYRDNVTVTVSY